jgi:phosphoribosylformylglycinamidine synthase PurS subunit
MAGPHRAGGPRKAHYKSFFATCDTRVLLPLVRPFFRACPRDPIYVARAAYRSPPVGNRWTQTRLHGLKIICPRRYDGPMRSSSGRTVRMEVRIELKPGVLDAEAESVEKSLALLGLSSVPKVGTARIYDLEFQGVTAQEARRLSQEAVDRLLANPVIHRVKLRPTPA